MCLGSDGYKKKRLSIAIFRKYIPDKSALARFFKIIQDQDLSTDYDRKTAAAMMGVCFKPRIALPAVCVLAYTRTRTPL
jgi:hypothetical protein